MKVICLLLAIAWFIKDFINPQPENMVISQIWGATVLILGAIDKAICAIQKGAE